MRDFTMRVGDEDVEVKLGVAEVWPPIALELERMGWRRGREVDA